MLVFNVIGFAEGYLLHDLGLQWAVQDYERAMKKKETQGPIPGRIEIND